MDELNKSTQKLFELRSYADIRAMKMRKTSLSFVLLRLEDGAKMVAGRVDT
jgi:hypothetical protein